MKVCKCQCTSTFHPTLPHPLFNMFVCHHVPSLVPTNANLSPHPPQPLFGSKKCSSRKWPLFRDAEAKVTAFLSRKSIFCIFCYIEPNMDHSGRPYGIWGALSLKEFARVLLIRFSVAFSKWFHPYWTISRSYILCKSNLQNPMKNDTFLVV